MRKPPAPRFARAVAPFLAATALVSLPALAQDATQQAQPVVTLPNAVTVPVPPVVRTVPDASATSDVPAAAPVAQSAPRVARQAPVRRAPLARVTPSAPAPATPVAAPTAAETTPPAATQAAPAAPAAAPAPSQSADDTATTTTTTATTQAQPAAGGIPTWALIAGAIAALAIIIGAIAAMRRRRTDDFVTDEPVYADQPYVEPVTEPLAVAPLAAGPFIARKPEPLVRVAEPAGEIEPTVATAEDIEVSEPAAADVAELTAGAAPVAERPWLEFAMRPLRAGTNVDEALVEIELTVGNAGSVAAQNVRISTFLLSGDPDGAEMERLLVAPPSDATTDPVTIEPGEGKRVDATLALLKSDMGENLPASFRPIIVADARYTLADGSEGRTSASFSVGVAPEDGGALEPIGLERASMHDNVGAELHGEPQHA